MVEAFSKKLFCLFSIALLLIQGAILTKAEDLKAEEIVARHLDSIGAKDERAAVKNLLAAGITEVVQKVPYRKLVGKTLIVSEAGNLFFVSGFNSADYRFEKIGYFSKKVQIPFVLAGNRSPLGGFLMDNNKIISEGLFTGSISTNWSLLDAEIRRAKIEVSGKKKIEGRETYILTYYPKNSISADFSIRLFFDAQNFQHVRSEYLYKLPARDTRIGTLGGNVDSGRRYLLTEDFGDFRKENGLTLPHSYKIYLLMDAQVQTGTVEYEWNFKISQYLFNQKLDANFFSFDEKN